eukprot:2713545-Rhodomonas_salina.2
MCGYQVDLFAAMKPFTFSKRFIIATSQEPVQGLHAGLAMRGTDIAQLRYSAIRPVAVRCDV